MPLKMQAELSTLLFLTQLLMSEFHTGHFSLLLWFFSLVILFCFFLVCVCWGFFVCFVLFWFFFLNNTQSSVPQKNKKTSLRVITT